MNLRTWSLAIALSVCCRAGIAGQESAAANTCDVIAGDVTDAVAAGGEPSTTSALGGKISRGTLICGLARALGRAWMQARADGPRRPAPSAEDDPFPQGEPADAPPDK